MPAICRVRPTARFIGEAGDWVCMPRRLLPRWRPDECWLGEAEPHHRPLPGGIDYVGTLITARVEDGGWSAHAAGPSTILRFSGYQASIFRRGLAALWLNRHLDAINHDFGDVERLTGNLPKAEAPEVMGSVLDFVNHDRDWVVFAGLQALVLPTKYLRPIPPLRVIPLRLPIGRVSLAMGWARTDQARREVSVFHVQSRDLS